MHNSTVDFRLRLLIRFTRAYGMFNIEGHIPLSTNLPSSVCLRQLTPYDYTLTILPRSLVMKWTSAPPVSVHLVAFPSFRVGGVTQCFFHFYNLRTYAHFQGEPIPSCFQSLIFRPCLFGFSQSFRVRRGSCRTFPFYTSCPVLCTPNSIFIYC
jgi:hypothetical protein